MKKDKKPKVISLADFKKKKKQEEEEKMLKEIIASANALLF